MWRTLTIISCFLLGACTEKAPSEADEYLKTAVKQGKWPQKKKALLKESEVLSIQPSYLRTQLGNYIYQAELTLTFTGNKSEESHLHETVTFQENRSGHFALRVDRQFRFVDAPDGQSGRQAIFDGTHLYTRLKPGKWIRREPMPGEVESWKTTATNHLDVFTRLLGDALTRNRTENTIALSLDRTRLPTLITPDTRPPPYEDTRWYGWWKTAHQIQTFNGSVTLDSTGGWIESGQITFRAKTQKTHLPRKDFAGEEPIVKRRKFGRRRPPPPKPPPPAPTPRTSEATLKASLTIHVKLADQPLVVAPPPKESVHIPKRTRVQHMVEKILGTEHTE